MDSRLVHHLGRAYEARILSRGNVPSALAAFRSEVAINPHLCAEALGERARLEKFLSSIPADQHRRCHASVENLKTLKEVFGV